MAYKGGVPVNSGFYPRNDFPIVEAKDVYVSDEQRLDAVIEGMQGTITDLTGDKNTEGSIAHSIATAFNDFNENTIVPMQGEIDDKVDKVDGYGLSSNDFTKDEKDKLKYIEANANNYTHPSFEGYKAHNSGLYKITVDEAGHISSMSVAQASDITELGIIGTDTVYDDTALSGRVGTVEEAIETLTGDKNKTGSIVNSINAAIAGYNETITGNLDGKVDKKEGFGLSSNDFTEAEKNKLADIADGANNYTHPSFEGYKAHNSGLYKITVDEAGHISSMSAVTKEDITDLDIPGQDTVYDDTALSQRVGIVEEALTGDENTDGSVAHSIATAFNDFNENTIEPMQVEIDEMGKTIENHNHNDLYYDKDEILGLITVEDIDDICKSNITSGENVDVVSMATKYWVEQFYQPKGNYLTGQDISTHNTSTESHSDIRLLISDLSNDLNTLANCDDETLDQMQEVVEYIKNNKSLIEGITTNKVNVSDIIDNLTTNVSNKPLSAAQGVVLKNMIENINVGTATNVDTTLSVEGAAADAKAVGDAIKVDGFTVELGSNGTMGGYKTGDVITEGTSIITILNKLLRKAVPATYTKPTISLSNNGGTASGNIEAGSTVTPKLRASFTKNDAGGLTSINIKQGSTVVASGTTTPLDYSGSSIVIGDNTITFTASADYSDAPVKNNNLGDESKENWFAGGTATSSSYSITGKRQLFYGTGAGALPTITSDVVRGLSGKKLAPANGNSFNIEVAEGQQHIIFAYPASLRDTTNITYVNANDPNMLANFTKSEIQVADARGGTNGLANYKVYTYAMEVQAAAAMTFKVTI